MGENYYGLLKWGFLLREVRKGPQLDVSCGRQDGAAPGQCLLVLSFWGLMTSPESLVRPLLRCIVPCIGKTCGGATVAGTASQLRALFESKARKSWVSDGRYSAAVNVSLKSVGIWNALHPSASFGQCFFMVSRENCNNSGRSQGEKMI